MSFIEDYDELLVKCNRVENELAQKKKEKTQLEIKIREIQEKIKESQEKNKELQDEYNLLRKILISEGYDPDELLKKYEAQKAKKQSIRDEASERNG